MTEITVPAKKFVRLFDYLQRIGIDAASVAATVELRMVCSRSSINEPDSIL